DSRFAHRTGQRKHRRETRPLRGRESMCVAHTRAVGLEVSQDAGPLSDPVGPVTQQVAALLVGDMADRLRESEGQASWVESAAGWSRKELGLPLVIRVAGAMVEDSPALTAAIARVVQARDRERSPAWSGEPLLHGTIDTAVE